jgi:hypothetical protein
MIPEQLQPKETEETKREAREPAAVVSITPERAESTYAERISMLESIEKIITPLMKQAIVIKLEREKEDMDALAANAAKLEAERVRRQGVLDSRFFRKRTL